MKPITPVNLNNLHFPKASAQSAQLLQALSAEDVDLADIDRIILHDPFLAGTIIRYANSPLYRRGGEITTIPSATRLIGLKNIRSAVVMATLSNILPINNQAASRINRHLLSVANLSRLVARQHCPELADEMELLGLLHDVGMVALVCNFPEQYEELFVMAQTEGRPLDVLEKQYLGITHDQVNVQAIHNFRLPDIDAMVIGHLHESLDSASGSDSAVIMRSVIMLAHHLLADYDADGFLPETLCLSQSELQDELGVDPAALKLDYDELTLALNEST